MMVTSATPTRALADFVAGLTLVDIPPHVQTRVKDILLDTFASALAGHDANESASLVETAQSIFGPGDTTVIGAHSLSLAGATMANGYLITAVTVCDVHRPTLCHVTPEVIPASLAVAERTGASGADLLTSIAAGLEVTTRVGTGIDYPEFRSRGWHSPGVTGPFGAAAAAGRLLRLDSTEMRYALGLAGSQATGSFAQLGTPGIKFSQARGALSGLLASELAAQGITSTDEILVDDTGGLYRTHSNGGDPAAVSNALGEWWELENISLRPWPVAAYLQTVVSTVMDLTREHAITPDEVRRLRIWISPGAYRMHGTVGWEDRFRARLSAQYVAAVVVVDRKCWLDQFTAERIADEALGSFATRAVEIIEDPALPDIAVTAEFELVDGSVHRSTRLVPHGDAEDPLKPAEVVDKFRSASSELLGEGSTENVIRLVESLEDVPDVTELIRNLRTT